MLLRTLLVIVLKPIIIQGLECYHCGSKRHPLEIGDNMYGSILPCSDKNKGIILECTTRTFNNTPYPQVGCINGDMGDGIVRQCTWNVPNWENRLENCPKEVEYCEVDKKAETGNNRQQGSHCNRWKNICYCQENLCNHGSKMFDNSFIGNAMILFLVARINNL